jgi:hypothetical protein
MFVKYFIFKAQIMFFDKHKIMFFEMSKNMICAFNDISTIIAPRLSYQHLALPMICNKPIICTIHTKLQTRYETLSLQIIQELWFSDILLAHCMRFSTNIIITPNKRSLNFFNPIPFFS